MNLKKNYSKDHLIDKNSPDKNPENLETRSYPTGSSTMSDQIAEAINYHNYLYKKFVNFLGKRVWEIGFGYGQYTKKILDSGKVVLATDIDKAVLENLKQRIQDPKLTLSSLDLNQKEDYKIVETFKPDSILCLNVLEHIENDILALENIRRSTLAGTTACFLTPAHQNIYGFMDSKAGHFRRYSIKTISHTFKLSGWRVKNCFYINPIGALGWFLQNKVFVPKEKSLNSAEVNRSIKLFDRYFIYPTKILDPLTNKFFGQSVVCIAENEQQK